MPSKNRELKKYPITEDIITDSVGKKKFEALADKFRGENQEALEVRKAKQQEVLSLMLLLKEENRLWRKDGTIVR